MEKGKINVQTENIFPIIKKFLYSDHEIFLRELISNAVDATKKIKALASLGEFKGELGDLRIKVEVDKKKKEIRIKDKGIGMTGEEVKKYINQIAFSGAEDFIQKYKTLDNQQQLIGHFGLGFYSSFMVSDKVEIITKSYKEDEKAVHWVCDGSPEFTLEECERTERGTDVILHISSDSEEFLEENRIKAILDKYCKFLPFEIEFGTETKPRTLLNGEYERDKDGKIIYDQVPRIINNTQPLWIKKPTELKDEDYINFYHELYPLADDPLFHIHLNVDYPFNLTGILYFPKVKNNFAVQKDKIQLYCNQVFVTDSVEGIVPEFLTLLHGVIDSPDIPLNVSRSYLQNDSNVKKISAHITKKVADKLEEIFKNKREEFQKKWDDIKIFIQYGMITEEKFYERAIKFVLFKNIDSKYYTFEEYEEYVKPLQTDKNKRIIFLYANNATDQHSYIMAAKEKGYDVLLMDGILDNHFIDLLERKHEKISFKRVDSDTIEKLIQKEEITISKLNEEEQNDIRSIFQTQLDNRFTAVVEKLSETDAPVLITQPEFYRRMQDIHKFSPMPWTNNMPEMYNLVINANHPLIYNISSKKSETLGNQISNINNEIKEINQQLEKLRKDYDKNKDEINKLNNVLNEKEKNRDEILKSFAEKTPIVKQLIDLALLSQNMLKGEELTRFINRSYQLIMENKI